MYRPEKVIVFNSKSQPRRVRLLAHLSFVVANDSIACDRRSRKSATVTLLARQLQWWQSGKQFHQAPYLEPTGLVDLQPSSSRTET